MKYTTMLIAALFAVMVIGIAGADVIDDREYFTEDTAIPFETFALVFGAGMLFLILATISGFSSAAGPTMIFGLISSLFLTVSAYAAPVTGFYSYVTNTTTNSTTPVTPVVWLVMQPWVMWMMWGLAVIAFILFVWGILILFQEKAHEEEMYWV